MKLHRTQDIPDPAERVTDLPDALRRFILKACDRDPAQRYQKVRAALEDLLPLAGLIGLRHIHPGLAVRRTTNVILSYNGENLEPLQRLLEKFTNEAKGLGIDLRSIDFKGE